MNGRLQGKAALITGAGSGVGYEMTKLFAAQGAQVAAVVLSDSSLKKWENVENVLPIQADITQVKDVDRMVDEAEHRFGRLDIVCNVAGITDLGFPLDETSD
jgi:NAD(P)-dependent dehydrogenase (short-subunit alcohol dehydrogenase family)